MNDLPQKPPQTILIVDDEPSNLQVLSRLLQPLYRVRAVNSGVRALEVAMISPQPDLILLDIMMPEMDGYAVLGHLKADAKTREVPVIFVTAMDAETDEEHGFKLGAVDYISKPVKPALLKARVQVHLELKHHRDLLKDQNAWLEAEVRRRMKENQMIQDVSLSALAELAETRDSDTGHHIVRTQAYVERLAHKMREAPSYAEILSDTIVSRIVKAAPLHDIGKIGIPDCILLKPGSLTKEEFEVMKRHSRIGGETIKRAIGKVTAHQNDQPNDEHPESLLFLEVAAVVATHHHERWEGGGYPEGLRGNEIPLAARLMAVADVFDALTSDRVYKAAMSVEKAVNLIKENRGTHFDPDVVDAFLEVIDDFKAIKSRYAD
jgi:putative two-component system response regulator